MGVTSTQDGSGKQLPLVIGPAGERGDDWLHAMGPHLPRLTMAAQKSWKNTGMLAGVTDCRRSRKWGCKGSGALGFKPRCSSHRGREPRGSEGKGRGPGSGSFGEVKRGPCGSEGKGRGPRGFAVLLFATRLRQQERLCREEKGRKDSCWWATRRCHMVLD